MSAIANLSSALAALPAANPHLHGHKKGPYVQSTDVTGSSGDGAAQVPAGLQQNLFGSLLNSLEQVIGVQATTPATVTATTAAPASAATAAAAAAAATTSDSTGTATVASPLTTAVSAISGAAHSSLTLVQNYLNNLLHNSRTDATPAAKLAGTNLNVTA